MVARGQTLASIAGQRRPRADIAYANNLPVEQAPGDGDRAHHPDRPARAAAPAARTPAPPRPPPPSADGPGPHGISYRVKPGDTLTAIASQYRTTVHELLSWNRLRDSRIATGNLLTVYTSRKFSPFRRSIAEALRPGRRPAAHRVVRDTFRIRQVLGSLRSAPGV